MYVHVTALHSQTAKEVVRNDQLLMAKERELRNVKATLCAMEDLMGLQMKEMYTHLDKVTAELEAAKEEIAVKVAQVKQYQKQVEAYKQQVCTYTCTYLHLLHVHKIS